MPGSRAVPEQGAEESEGLTRMPKTNTDIEYFILNRIRTEEMPLGAVTIREELEKAGYAMSETGVGRLLKSYRKLGYLERDVLDLLARPEDSRA